MIGYMGNRIKTIIMKILIFILVWFGSMLLMGIIGAIFNPDSVSPLLALLILVLPVSLATLAILPRNKDHSAENPQDGFQNSTSSSLSNTTSPKKSIFSPPKTTYILNPQTMVFHRKSCKYAQRLHDSQTVLFDDRSAVKMAGYRPCKYCKP